MTVANSPMRTSVAGGLAHSHRRGTSLRAQSLDLSGGPCTCALVSSVESLFRSIAVPGTALRIAVDRGQLVDRLLNVGIRMLEENVVIDRALAWKLELHLHVVDSFHISIDDSSRRRSSASMCR